MRSSGLISYFYNNAEPNMHQIQAYTRATKTAAYQQSDWILALDLDEFLTIKTPEGTLKSWFNKLPSADYIVVNWRLFGSSYQNIPHFDLTTRGFIVRIPMVFCRKTDHGYTKQCSAQNDLCALVFINHCR
jgi:hypothetical protein